MKKRSVPIILFISIMLALAGCTKEVEQSLNSNELKHFPLNSMEGIISQSGIFVDRDISNDGKGSLRIKVEQPATVRLLEVRDVDVEDSQLLYRARVRTEDFKGQVYLEMWVNFPGKGEFFTRNVHTPLSGTANWTTMVAPFFLKKGQNPDYVKLNLVMDGAGTAWIDDIRLVKGPLK